MTYRANRGSRASRRRADKEQKYGTHVQAGVRTWLSRHPPRVELPNVFGVWRGGRDEAREHWYFVEFGERPTAPLMRISVMRPSRNSTIINTGDLGSLYSRDIMMRPIEMGLTVDSTVVRWWNWEPTQGTWDGQVEADIWRAINKTVAFMTRLKPVVTQLAGMDRWSASHYYRPEEIAQWWDETIEALSSWMGNTRLHYVIPSARPNGAPEERELLRRG